MSEELPVDRGRFEARYLAFLETVTHIRPRLHRYCSRMTGSPFDGEDVLQDALFEAYRKLDSYDDSRPLAPWLFRIAHHRAIDHLRRRGVRDAAEARAAAPDAVEPDVSPDGAEVRHALEHLVGHLPPMERAAVLLKDVFDYSLEETADLVDSSVGASRRRCTAVAGSSNRWPERPRRPFLSRRSACNWHSATRMDSTAAHGTNSAASFGRTRGSMSPIATRAD